MNDPNAEFRRTDFVGNRDVNFDEAGVVDELTRAYKYWIAMTDCDGLRLDTLKHVDAESGRNFCGTVKEFAANRDMADFFLIGEVAGARSDADLYLRALSTNLNAVLEIGGDVRPVPTAVAKGLLEPKAYFDATEAWDDQLGSHRNVGRRVSVLDDHDHVSGEKVRFSSDAHSANRQVVVGVALQLFPLGIP